MHFDDGDADGADAVGEGDGSVGIASWVHHHCVESAVSGLKLVDETAFMVRLEIRQLVLRKPLLQRLEISFERYRTIDFWLAFSEQIEVGTVDDKYFHCLIFLQK